MSLEGYTGRLALVTGAGDGIGEMLAKSLAAAGMRVAVQDIRAEAAERVARDIGETAFPVVFDVSEREACFNASDRLKADEEGLNLLWINAGVGVGASLLDASARTVEWAYGVNVLGAIWTAQAFAPLLSAIDGPKHLGVTASSASLVAPEAPFPLYAATKHASLAVGEALAAELRGQGIGTTLLCPGLLNTNIWDGARARPERFGGPAYMDPAFATRWNEALTPDVMWPLIAESISAGGGYLACITEERTAELRETRQASIKAGWRFLNAEPS